MPRSSLSASCLCRSVQYTVSGKDRGAVLCHCANCRKASGSAFAHNYRFTESDIRFDRGEELVREYEDSETRSGSTLFRHFCSKCGSPVYMRSSAIKGFMVVHCGVIDSHAKTAPKMELFGEGKYSWVGDVATRAKV